MVYSLALAVYCSSWTFYGAVGTAVSNGWAYLPIYLGPILLFVFFSGILRAAHAHRPRAVITSIADFIGSRYGKSQGLAALVTVIALIAAVPYLALQFKAVAMSIAVLSGTGPSRVAPVLADRALYVALLLAVFAILFGTRQVDATEHHHGLMLAVALESLVKLLAFVAVGLFALHYVPEDCEPAVRTRALASSNSRDAFGLRRPDPAGLPRDVLPAAAVPGRRGRVRRPGRPAPRALAVPAYLVVICVLVLPIALAGMAAVRRQRRASGHSYVLRLPLAHGQNALALFAYLGGFSAATGMVIVASVALATMVSNDLVMPALLRSRRYAQGAPAICRCWCCGPSRITIVGLALLAYAYHRAAETHSNLASIGLLPSPRSRSSRRRSSAACTGAAPAARRDRRPAAAALRSGPTPCCCRRCRQAGWIDAGWTRDGPFGIAWLKPQALFGLSGWDPDHPRHLLVAAAQHRRLLILLSLRFRPSIDERLRALPFLDPWPSGDAPVGAATGADGSASATCV
jgi:hypothetical protein